MALYIHIPYCEAKCHYCDFNSFAGREREFAAFVHAVCEDIERSAAAHPLGPLGSVFIGGGTPSTLPAPLIRRVLDTARAAFGFAEDVEITSEANPGSLNESFLETLLDGGLTRLSLGVQALDDATLQALGRVHTRVVAEEAVALARRAGVPSLNLDFIFGAPGQTEASWRKTLQEAVALGPDHLSLYGLIIEEGTAFGRLHAAGALHVPDDDSQADMYDATVEVTRAAGFAQYEISNYARPGHECRHNLMYWANGEYVGVGPGAVSYVNGWRTTKTRRPAEYIRRVRERAVLVEEGERVSWPVSVAETLVLGLRTRAGVDVAACAARFGVSPVRLRALVAGVCAGMFDGGFVRWDGDRLALTDPGVEVSNGVMERILELPAYLTADEADDTLKVGVLEPGMR